MPPSWHTVADPTADLIGKRVRLFKASNGLLIGSGRVTAYYSGGDVHPCGHEHGAGIALVPYVEDLDNPKVRKIVSDYMDQCIRLGIRPSWGLDRIRVEVLED
jgi:hypothetical protein